MERSRREVQAAEGANAASPAWRERTVPICDGWEGEACAGERRRRKEMMLLGKGFLEMNDGRIESGLVGRRYRRKCYSAGCGSNLTACTQRY